MFVSRDGERKGFGYKAGGPELNKLFVRNINTELSKEQASASALETCRLRERKRVQVEAIFASQPGFKSARLAVHKSGQFKGIAYVEFDSPANATAALDATNEKVQPVAHICALSLMESIEGGERAPDQGRHQ